MTAMGVKVIRAIMRSLPASDPPSPIVPGSQHDHEDAGRTDCSGRTGWTPEAQGEWWLAIMSSLGTAQAAPPSLIQQRVRRFRTLTLLIDIRVTRRCRAP